MITAEWMQAEIEAAFNGIVKDLKNVGMLEVMDQVEKIRIDILARLKMLEQKATNPHGNIIDVFCSCGLVAVRIIPNGTEEGIYKVDGICRCGQQFKVTVRPDTSKEFVTVHKDRLKMLELAQAVAVARDRLAHAATGDPRWANGTYYKECSEAELAWRAEWLKQKGASDGQDQPKAGE